MKKILLFLLLTLPVLLLAQYPTTGNKQRLGWQTTGDGLVYRDAGYPSYTPNSRNNAYVYMDTVAKRYYHFANGAWYDLSDEKYIHRQDQSVLALAVRDSLTTYDRLFIAMEITSGASSDRGVQLPVTAIDSSYAGRVVRVSALDSSGTYNVFVSSSSPDGLLVNGALATTYYLAADETAEFQLYVFDTIYQWRLTNTTFTSPDVPQTLSLTDYLLSISDGNTIDLFALLSTRPKYSGAGKTNTLARWLNDSTLVAGNMLDDGTRLTANTLLNLESYPTISIPGAITVGDIFYNSTEGNFGFRGASQVEYPLKSATANGLGSNQRIFYSDANGRATTSSLFTFDGSFVSTPRLNITRSTNAYFNFTSQGLIFGTTLSGWATPSTGFSFHWNGQTANQELFFTHAGLSSNGQSSSSPLLTLISKYYESGSGKSEDYSIGTIRTSAALGGSYFGIRYGTHSTSTTTAMSGRSALTDYFRLYSNSGHLQLPMYLSSGNFEASDLGKTESNYAAWFATDGTIVQKQISSYAGWTLAGDSGTPQTVGSGETASILGGFGINTTASTTDILTVEADTGRLVTHEQLQRSLDSLDCTKDLTFLGVDVDTVYENIEICGYQEVGYTLDSIVLVGTGAIFIGSDYNSDPDCNYEDVQTGLEAAGFIFPCSGCYIDYDCDEVDGYLDFCAEYPNTGTEVFEIYQDGELSDFVTWEDYESLSSVSLYGTENVISLITSSGFVSLTNDTLFVPSTGTYSFELVYQCGDTVKYRSTNGYIHRLETHIDNHYIYVSKARGNDVTGRINDINFPFETLEAACAAAQVANSYIYFLADYEASGTKTSYNFNTFNPVAYNLVSNYVIPENVRVSLGIVDGTASTALLNKSITFTGDGELSLASIYLGKNISLFLNTNTASLSNILTGNGYIETNNDVLSVSFIVDTGVADSTGITFLFRSQTINKNFAWYSKSGGSAGAGYQGYVYADKIAQLGEAFTTNRAVNNLRLYIECGLYENTTSTHFLAYFDNAGFTNSLLHIKAKRFTNAMPLINEYFRPGSGQSGQFIFEVDDYQYTGTQSLVYRTTGAGALDGSNADGSPMYVFRGNFTSATTAIVSRGTASTSTMLFEGTFKVVADSVKAFVWSHSTMTDNAIRFKNATIINTNAAALDKTSGAAAKIRVENSIIQNSNLVNNLIETFSSFYRPALGGVTTMEQKTVLIGTEKLELINEDKYVTIADVTEFQAAWASIIQTSSDVIDAGGTSQSIQNLELEDAVGITELTDSTYRFDKAGKYFINVSFFAATDYLLGGYIQAFDATIDGTIIDGSTFSYGTFASGWQVARNFYVEVTANQVIKFRINSGSDPGSVEQFNATIHRLNQ